jgi:hypothetical protein
MVDPNSECRQGAGRVETTGRVERVGEADVGDAAKPLVLDPDLAQERRVAPDVGEHERSSSHRNPSAARC